MGLSRSGPPLDTARYFRTASPAPAWRCFLHESLPKLRLPLLVEQRSQFGTGILLPAITEAFDHFGPVAPCNFRRHSWEESTILATSPSESPSEIRQSLSTSVRNTGSVALP